MRPNACGSSSRLGAEGARLSRRKRRKTMRPKGSRLQASSPARNEKVMGSHEQKGDEDPATHRRLMPILESRRKSHERTTRRGFA